MTEELKELGLNAGHRRVVRLMHENGTKVERAKQYKATTIARQAIAKQFAEKGRAIKPSTSRRTC